MSCFHYCCHQWETPTNKLRRLLKLIEFLKIGLWLLSSAWERERERERARQREREREREREWQKYCVTDNLIQTLSVFQFPFYCFSSLSVLIFIANNVYLSLCITLSLFPGDRGWDEWVWTVESRTPVWKRSPVNWFSILPLASLQARTAMSVCACLCVI